MLTTRRGIRPLGPGDLDAFLALTALDPVVNVFAEYRARSSRLEARWLGGEIWGRFTGGDLVAACHVGANLVPVQVDAAAAVAFAERATQRGTYVSTIFGPEESVKSVFAAFGGGRATPRDMRMGQPHLEIDVHPAIAPDRAVRLSTRSDLDLLYPACVAMYTEEVGVSPETGAGGNHYLARVKQLIDKHWSFVRIENGRVIFKAEVACVTPYAAQIQGVYVDPEYRNRGIAAPALAAVVERIHAQIAPIASLYVNEWNQPARRAYDRVGFRETATFGTVMFH